MPKFRVPVFSEMKCWDAAYIEVEAPTAEAAKKSALRTARRGEIDAWEPAESETFTTTGRYDTGNVEEI